MKVSYLKIAWKYLTGGKEGVLDYVLDEANTFVASLGAARQDEIRECLAAAKKGLAALEFASRWCPDRWATAYAATVSAFADVVSALSDLKLTADEVAKVCESFHLAYAAWRAE